MNTFILINSLKYLRSFYIPVSLASWIYDELSLIKYSDQKLEKSFDLLDFEVSKSIIKHLKDKDFLDQSLLLFAEDSEKIQALIKFGANVSVNDNELLKYTCKYGHDEIVELCLKNGADIHCCDDQPLKDATCCNHIKIVKLLLKYGANVHAEEEEASLIYAILNSNIEMTKLLLDYGANLNIIDRRFISGSSNSIKQLLSNYEK